MALKDFLFYKDDWAEIYCGDCREILPILEPVDLVLTSPPFKDQDTGSGINDHLNRIVDPNGKYYEWFSFWLNLIRKISKTIVCFNSSVRLVEICSRFKPDKILVWDKLRTQGAFRYEPIFVWGEFQNNLIWNDCLRFLPILKQKIPYENPINLYTQLLRYFPAAITVDCFLGSGTTCVAAKNLNRKSVGIEINPKYCEIAVKRLRQESFDFRKPMGREFDPKGRGTDATA